MSSQQSSSDVPSVSASTLRSYYPLGTQERHHLDTQLATAKRAALELKYLEEASKECAFRPRVNDRFLSNGGVNTPTEASEEAPPSATSATAARDVFSRLSQQAEALEERQRRREEQKLRDEANMQRQAFRPIINQNTLLSSRLKHLDNIAVEDRLLFYGKAVERNTQLRREQREHEEIARTRSQHSARPRHGDDAAERRREQREFDERNARLLSQRELNRQLAEQREAGKHTFHPKICATSAAIDALTRQQRQEERRVRTSQTVNSSPKFYDATTLGTTSTSAGARAPGKDSRTQSTPCTADRATLLYEQATAARKRLQGDDGRGPSGSAAAASVEARPRTNPLSEQWIQHSQHQALFETSFVHRQALYEEAKQEQLALLAKQREAEEARELQMTATARTRQGDTSAANSARAPAEVIEAQVQRLYYRPQLESQSPEHAVDAKAREWATATCPFRPQLSTGTRQYLKRVGGKREKDTVKRLTACSRGSAVEATEQTDAPATSYTTPRKPQSAPDGPEQQPLPSPKDPCTPPLKRWDSSPARVSVQELYGSAGGFPSPTGGGTSPAQALDGSPANAKRVTDSEAADFFKQQLQFVRAKEERLRLERQEEVVNNLAECTFQPTTLRPPAGLAERSSSATVGTRVCGVQQYLRRQAEAQKLKLEKEEKANSLGRVRGDVKAQRTTDGATVVEPFRLQTADRGRGTAARSPVVTGDAVGVRGAWRESSLLGLHASSQGGAYGYGATEADAQMDTGSDEEAYEETSTEDEESTVLSGDPGTYADGMLTSPQLSRPVSEGVVRDGVSSSSMKDPFVSLSQSAQKRKQSRAVRFSDAPPTPHSATRRDAHHAYDTSSLLQRLRGSEAL